MRSLSRCIPGALALLSVMVLAAPALAAAVAVVEDENKPAEKASPAKPRLAEAANPAPASPAGDKNGEKTDAEKAVAPAEGDKKADDAPLTDVAEIVRRANLAAYYQGDDGKAKVKMTIWDSKEDKEKDRSRSREFTILRKNVAEGGDQYFYVYFNSPPDVRKMVYRVWKHVGDKDDDRWLYMPSLDRVNRVAASDKRTSFVGSHFVYEDVSGRGTEEDTHTLIETSDTQYVLKNVPTKPNTVEFAWYKLWIDRKTFLPVKTEYYNAEGKVYRLIEALKTETIESGDKKFPTVTKARAVNLETGGETMNEFSDVEYNLGLKEEIFTEERYLRRAPPEARR